jgi:hypothetical protein
MMLKTRLAVDRPTMIRLFLSVWLVLMLHFATNISREHYPAITLAEHGTLAVDEYVDLHPDLFVAPTGHAVINNPPGVSILAAVPLLIGRPLMAWAERRAKARLPSNVEDISATYHDPRPNRQRFFRLTRQRGLDLKFGVVAALTAAGLMAPMTAGFALLMFRLLAGLGLGAREALLWAVLSVFATPLFFRAAYLNHNHVLGLLVFLAFVLLWRQRATTPRLLAAGALAGWSVFCDYSAIVPLMFLGVWAVFEGRDEGAGVASTRSARAWRGLLFAAGAAGPLAGLLIYQWWAFGGPLTVPQAVMPPTQYSVTGYNGFAWPQPDLILANLFDLRFGVFAAAPILLLALPGAWLMPRSWLTTRQTWLVFGFMAAFVLFCSANQFARLQWNTGVRYLIPLVPFLFLYAIPVLRRLPPIVTQLLLVGSIAHAWVLAMARESVADSWMRVLTGGPELPWLTVLGKTAAQYAPSLSDRPSPLPVLLIAAAALMCLWWTPARRAPRVIGSVSAKPN